MHSPRTLQLQWRNEQNVFKVLVVIWGSGVGMQGCGVPLWHTFTAVYGKV